MKLFCRISGKAVGSLIHKCRPFLCHLNLRGMAAISAKSLQTVGWYFNDILLYHTHTFHHSGYRSCLLCSLEERLLASVIILESVDLLLDDYSIATQDCRSGNAFTLVYNLCIFLLEVCQKLLLALDATYLNS